MAKGANVTVTFTYKNGRERRMTRQEAEVLRRLGYGQYVPKDMRAATGMQPAHTAAAVVQAPVVTEGPLAPGAKEAVEQPVGDQVKKPRGRPSKPKPESKQ